MRPRPVACACWGDNWRDKPQVNTSLLSTSYTHRPSVGVIVARWGLTTSISMSSTTNCLLVLALSLSLAGKRTYDTYRCVVPSCKLPCLFHANISVHLPVGSGGLAVRALDCRSKGRWFEWTCRRSKLRQFRSPHFLLEETPSVVGPFSYSASKPGAVQQMTDNEIGLPNSCRLMSTRRRTDQSIFTTTS